ncbi:MAG TPA: response regulator transcription factor [Streptosporangiaceae bacterium]|jgi:DNA-binding NarL/FixJ family response regulator
MTAPGPEPAGQNGGQLGGQPGGQASGQDGRRIRVLAADDQRVVREGLALLLSLLPDVEVVGTAADGEQAVAQAVATQPDVVLMDLRMPHLDGAAATRLLRERCPDVRVIVLTTYADDRSVIDALRAGARGYLTKDAGAEEIRRALHDVTRGRAVIDPAVQGHLVDAIAAPDEVPPASVAPANSAHPGPADSGAPITPAAITPAAATDPTPDAQVLAASLGLTPREGEVLALIAEGLSNGEIAGRLVVSEATVKSHVNHLLAKIGARGRAQAVSVAYQHGLTPPVPPR